MAITPRSFFRNPLLLFLLSALIVLGSGFASLCFLTCDRQAAETEALTQVRLEAEKAQQAATEEQAEEASAKEHVPGWLGVRIQSLTPQRAARVDAPRNLRGALVLGLQKGMPAQKAGILPRDVITHFDGTRIKSSCQLTKEVAARPSGKVVEVRVVREGVPMILLPELTTRPEDCGCKKKETK